MEVTEEKLGALGGCDEANTVCSRRCPRARTLSRAIRKPSARKIVAAAQIRIIKCERGSRTPPWTCSSELYSCLAPALEAKRTLPGEEVDEAVLKAVVTRSSERAVRLTAARTVSASRCRMVASRSVKAFGCREKTWRMPVTVWPRRTGAARVLA